jgi:hypothetical protein
MDRRNVLTALAASALAAPAGAAPTPKDAGDARVAWVRDCYADIRAVKPGQTRGDLLKKFKQAGGLYNRRIASYMYTKCPYFKISVTFEPAGPGEKLSADDKIVKVSTPYLEDPLAE